MPPPSVPRILLLRRPLPPFSLLQFIRAPSLPPSSSFYPQSVKWRGGRSKPSPACLTESEIRALRKKFSVFRRLLRPRTCARKILHSEIFSKKTTLEEEDRDLRREAAGGLRRGRTKRVRTVRKRGSANNKKRYFKGDGMERGGGGENRELGMRRSRLPKKKGKEGRKGAPVRRAASSPSSTQVVGSLPSTQLRTAAAAARMIVKGRGALGGGERGRGCRNQPPPPPQLRLEAAAAEHGKDRRRREGPVYVCG